MKKKIRVKARWYYIAKSKTLKKSIQPPKCWDCIDPPSTLIEPA